MGYDSRCGCDVDGIAGQPKWGWASYTIQVVDGIDDKARIYPRTGVIQVDKALWSRWSDVERQAVLAHEMAHDEFLNACESCIDARAGARLRWAGVSLQASCAALAGIVSGRATSEYVARGWRAADDLIHNRAVTRAPGELKTVGYERLPTLEEKQDVLRQGFRTNIAPVGSSKGLVVRREADIANDAAAPTAPAPTPEVLGDLNLMDLGTKKEDPFWRNVFASIVGGAIFYVFVKRG